MCAIFTGLWGKIVVFSKSVFFSRWELHKPDCFLLLSEMKILHISVCKHVYVVFLNNLSSELWYHMSKPLFIIITLQLFRRRKQLCNCSITRQHRFFSSRCHCSCRRLKSLFIACENVGEIVLLQVKWQEALWKMCNYCVLVSVHSGINTVE